MYALNFYNTDCFSSFTTETAVNASKPVVGSSRNNT